MTCLRNISPGVPIPPKLQGTAYKRGQEIVEPEVTTRKECVDEGCTYELTVVWTSGSDSSNKAKSHGRRRGEQKMSSWRVTDD